jgi:hypothetical protein
MFVTNIKFMCTITAELEQIVSHEAEMNEHLLTWYVDHFVTKLASLPTYRPASTFTAYG